MDFPFPYVGDRDLTATVSREDHIRQLLEQLLFTRPGERVNRPDFGCGLLDLVFGPNSPEVAAALRLTIASAVQRWLGDLIELTDLEVDSEEGTLTAQITYRVIDTGETVAASLSGSGTP